MQFDPIQFQNNLGRTVLVRSALEEDAAALLQYLRETTAETPFLLWEPVEVTMTLEQEKAFIRQTLAAPRSLMLAAFCWTVCLHHLDDEGPVISVTHSKSPRGSLLRGFSFKSASTYFHKPSPANYLRHKRA